MKVAFFGTELIDKSLFQNLFAGNQIIFFDKNLNDGNIPLENDFEIISVTVKSEVSKKVIDSFASLKMISVRATGFDKIDTDYASQKSILVCNVPEYGSNTVAEFAFGLMLSLTRKIPQGIFRVKDEKKFSCDGLTGQDLFDATLGVIGAGKIGINVIKIAKGFGMKVLAYDMYPDETLANKLGFSYESLEELLKKSDIVTLHCPLNKETRHLINKENISLMKDGSILINTARGEIIDTFALYEAVCNGKLAGVAVDVLEKEDYMYKDIMGTPDEINSIIEVNTKLIQLPNVFVTPHTAFNTSKAKQSIIETTGNNILKFIEGSPVNTLHNK